MEPDDVVITDIGGQALDIFLHGPDSAHKNGIVKTFTHTCIPIYTCTHLKQTKSKTLNSLNMTPSFTCPLPVQRGGGRRPGVFADAPRDCSMSEARPRTILTENICRCVQHILHVLQHFPTTMPFLTTSEITFSCLASATGHVEPDDVVITDIGGQARDIFLHGPQSAHKNSIVNTFTHTSIPIHRCTLLKNRIKKEKKNKNKMLNSPNIMLSFTGPLPVQCGGGRRPGRMAPAPRECPTVEVFLPRTVLTENICRCVQRVLQHFPTTIPILTASTITFSWIASTPHQADSC